MQRSHDFKDLSAGAVFIGVGLFFSVYALFNLRLGTAGNMGPGYFPLTLGMVMIALGAVVAVQAIGKRQQNPWGSASVRGIALVTLSIVYFGFSVRTLGLGPALAGSTLLAAFASSRTTLLGATLLTIAMTAFCLILFVWVLRLPLTIIGPWLGGY